MRRRPAAAVAALALVLAGCAAPLPVADPDPVPVVVPPALTLDQAERVVADVARALAAGDDSSDHGEFDERLTGPALDLRLNEHTLVDAGVAEGLTPIPDGARTIAVPATTAWPRTFLAVTEAPADVQPPVLQMFTQVGPRAQYQLWSWVRLFPGVTTPPLTRPEVGSAATGEPVSSPDEIMAAYLDVLTLGEESAHLAEFEPDPLREGIVATRTAYTELVGENGLLAETYQPVGGVRTIGTADGGAIVVGAFETVTAITLDDATLTLGGQVATLLGQETVETSLAFTWLSVVAFHVPAAATPGPVSVLGAEHSMTSISGE